MADTNEVTDAVCGMTLDSAAAAHHTVHEDQDFYLFGKCCNEKFEATPDRYLHPANYKPDPVIEGALYICPMFPEVAQIGPGACPSCGMALVYL